MTTSGAWIGVDICKKFLDVGSTAGTPVRVANDADERAALARRLKSDDVRGVIVEATGGLERALVKALEAEGVAAAIVNPARVRKFAEGTGQLAKTDRIDAIVLARYGAYMQPAPTLTCTRTMRESASSVVAKTTLRSGDKTSQVRNSARIR